MRTLDVTHPPTYSPSTKPPLPATFRPMRALRLCLVFVLVALAAASATAPRPHDDVKRSRLIPAPLDATWQAIIMLFGERNWPIATIDRSSGLIATDWLRMPDDVADCGTAPLATTLGTKGRFTVFLLAGADGTQLTVSATFQRVREFDGSVHAVDCVSLGVVESSVISRVTARAAGVMEPEPPPLPTPASAARSDSSPLRR